MKLKMKTKATLLTMLFLIIMMSIIPVMAAKPTYEEVSFQTTAFHWRARDFDVPFGAWSETEFWQSSTHYRLTGNVLHHNVRYSSPWKPDKSTWGLSQVYVYDGVSRWILHEGKVSMMSTYYGNYKTVYYSRGYMEFSGTPSTDNFVHGVHYQWVYIMKPEKEPVNDALELAVWDPVMNAWLVGFSVYIRDPSTPSPPHPLTFPDPFPRPIPAKNYNPLGL